MKVNYDFFFDDIPKNEAVINFRNYKSLDVADYSNNLSTSFE